ncbi:MAG: DUF933 domain-containing protein [Planctomycetota bacterium]|jgi:hypothetical protein|nr:DUF933 domain-containing protein [Planctomycetota bacterium]
MQVALTGIPGTGVKTIFSAITGNVEEAGASSWNPGQSRLVSLRVPDERLDIITEVYKPKKKTYATVELVEFPGLFGSPSTDNAAIGKIRQTDAIVIVLRTFESQAFPHPSGSIDPARDLERIYSDFVIADLEVLETRHERLEKNLARMKKDEDVAEFEVLCKCRELLNSGKGVSEAGLSEDESKLIRSFGFLTEKPLVLLINVGESQLGDEESAMSAFVEKGYEAQALCGSLEAELCALDEEERAEFMSDFGVTELAAPAVLSAIFRRLSILTFFTYGEDECRAWNVEEGDTAVDAAGKVHTDLARGFIRAEVVAWDDFKEHGSVKDVKAAGKFRLEGKEYLVNEGDLIIIRHNA